MGADPIPGPVEVVVPVHGAHDVAGECLRSLARHTDLGRHRLRVVVDGDPDFHDEDVRRALAGEEVEILRHPTCRGFVASVNAGMALSSRDVVLLNSDTVVTAGWLEKMQAAAYSHPAIATVTPLSNNATICSLPRPQVVNELPRGHDVDSFGRLVEEVSERRYPRIPSGVGMCLYLKRRVLDRLGLFDQASFGQGYGEETEFCFRALQAGFVHVLDDATFIFHHGERSFGGRREARARSAEKTLARLHPEYLPTIAEFLRRDPLRGVRERVVARLCRAAAGGRPRPARVLHVVHGWPPYNHAGTELYARWLAELQSRERDVAVYGRVADPDRSLGEAIDEVDSGMRVRLTVNNFTQRNPLSRNALHNRILENDFGRYLAEVEPDLVHFHHLAGHAVSLVARAAARGVPIVYQIQDWWAMCARANLLHADRGLCSGPAPAKCSACLPMTGIPPAGLWNRLLYGYRRRWMERCLRLADAYVMGSRYIEKSYREQGLLREADQVHVLPYGVNLASPVPPRRREAPEPGRPLRCGYIGSILPHKGVHVAVEAFREIDPRKALLEIWGDPEISPDYTRELRAGAPEAVLRFHGRFAESEKDDILRSLDVLVLPSLGLESFGLVAREALAFGVPVLASYRGALQELFGAGSGPSSSGRGGAFFEPGDAGRLRRLVEEVVERPETLDRWIREAPRVVGCAEHARAVEEVYAGVLERRGRR